MTRRTAAAIVTIATGVAVTLVLAFHGADALELPARDAAVALLPARPAASTAVVAIDEPSIRAIGAWPWPRDLVARIVDAAAAAKARAVVLDILLTEPRSGDERLAEAMKHIPSIAVSVLDERGEWLVPAPAIGAATTAAHGNFELDHDGILRRLATTKQSRDRSLTAVSLEAAGVLVNSPVRVGQTIAPAFRTRPRSVPRISAAAILANPAAAAPLRGRLVFIGPTALGLGDRVLTPVSASQPDPGVTVHAAATESLLRHELVRELPPIGSGAIAALAILPIVAMRRRRARLLVAAAAAVTIVAGGMILLATSGVAIAIPTLLMATIAVAIGVEAVAVAAMIRETSAAAERMEVGLGLSTRRPDDVAPRLEDIALHLASSRARDAESKRVLAHELKTPLASMRNLSQLLGGYELTEAERKRVTSLIESEAEKLQSMVNGLLDLERLSLRDFRTSSSLVDLSDLVARRIEFLRAGTDRELRTSIAPGVFVDGDPSLLERVVDNLVGNALKYSPPPAPASIAVQRAGSSAVMEVLDEGPGISAADRERIFSRFFRGATARGTEGLGLGLSLVAEVVQWHHGEVRIEDGPGGGALFRVTLPLAAGAARAGGM